MRIGIKTGARSFRENGSGPVTNKSESASRVRTLSCQSCQSSSIFPGRDDNPARARCTLCISTNAHLHTCVNAIAYRSVATPVAQTQCVSILVLLDVLRSVHFPNKASKDAGLCFFRFLFFIRFPRLGLISYPQIDLPECH